MPPSPRSFFICSSMSRVARFKLGDARPGTETNVAERQIRPERIVVLPGFQLPPFLTNPPVSAGAWMEGYASRRTGLKSIHFRTSELSTDSGAAEQIVGSAGVDSERVRRRRPSNVIARPAPTSPRIGMSATRGMSACLFHRRSASCEYAAVVGVGT